MFRYWTDNGACYYYNTSSKYSNYNDLLNAVKADADKSGLPYRYMQVSTWQIPSSHNYTRFASILPWPDACSVFVYVLFNSDAY